MFSKECMMQVQNENIDYKLTMDDSQDWCDEVVLWYHLDFNHSIRREGTYCLLVNWDKCQKDKPCVATLPLLDCNVDIEEYKMHVMLNNKLYERQMVHDDQLNMPMENNEGLTEEKIRKKLHER